MSFILFLSFFLFLFSSRFHYLSLLHFFLFTLFSFLNFCYRFSLSVILHLFYYYYWWFFDRLFSHLVFLSFKFQLTLFLFFAFFVSIEILPKLIPALSRSALSSFYCRHYIFISFFKLHLFLFISSAFLSFASLSLVIFSLSVSHLIFAKSSVPWRNIRGEGFCDICKCLRAVYVNQSRKICKFIWSRVMRIFYFYLGKCFYRTKWIPKNTLCSLKGKRKEV